MTAILNQKNEIIKKSSKYHNYTDVFDENNVKKLFEHRFHDHAIEIKCKIFFSILSIICLLPNLKLSKNL